MGWRARPARSRNPEIRILCASFQSPPEGEGGEKWHSPRGYFARSSRARHIFWTATSKGFCAQRDETSILAKRYVRRVRFVRTRASLEKSCAKSLLREISYFWQVLLEIFETFSWKTLSEDVMISIDPIEGEVYFDPSLFVETKVYHCVNF